MLTKKAQTKSNRLKKPYCGKNRNRKGNKSDSGTKESLNPNKPVRFEKKKLQQRVYNILNIEVCQVCEKSHDLDYPHHVMQGAKKDDRYMINICVECHRLIHEVGYRAVDKWREECKHIAWDNHERFENLEKEK